MKIIRVWLYKNSKTFFWWLIRWKQSFTYENRYARYSHAELILEDWLCFSSSEVDKWVRFKEIDLYSWNWDVVSIPVSDQKYDKIVAFCKSQEWNAYNWIWIFLAQTLNVNRKWLWDWFCSEIVTRALQEAHLFCTISALFVCPAELGKMLEDNWYKIISN